MPPAGAPEAGAAWAVWCPVVWRLREARAAELAGRGRTVTGAAGSTSTLHTAHTHTWQVCNSHLQCCQQCCLQCFDAVGWAAGRPSGLYRVVRCWRGYLSGARCRLAMHMAQLMPLPLNVFRFSKIQIGFTFLVPHHSGSPGQRAVKRVYVCVCVASGRPSYYSNCGRVARSV